MVAFLLTGHYYNKHEKKRKKKKGYPVTYNDD